MIKKIDTLGRIGIPKAIREDMTLDHNDLIFIDYDFDKKEITIKKAKNRCFVCNCDEDLLRLPNDYYLCQSCFRQIKTSEDFDVFSEK